MGLRNLFKRDSGGSEITTLGLGKRGEEKASERPFDSASAEQMDLYTGQVEHGYKARGAKRAEVLINFGRKIGRKLESAVSYTFAIPDMAETAVRESKDRARETVTNLAPDLGDQSKAFETSKPTNVGAALSDWADRQRERVWQAVAKTKGLENYSEADADEMTIPSVLALNGEQKKVLGGPVVENRLAKAWKKFSGIAELGMKQRFDRVARLSMQANQGRFEGERSSANQIVEALNDENQESFLTAKEFEEVQGLAKRHNLDVKFKNLTVLADEKSVAQEKLRKKLEIMRVAPEVMTTIEFTRLLAEANEAGVDVRDIKVEIGGSRAPEMAIAQAA